METAGIRVLPHVGGHTQWYGLVWRGLALLNLCLTFNQIILLLGV